jgi:hypothetical protein
MPSVMRSRLYLTAGVAVLIAGAAILLVSAGPGARLRSHRTHADVSVVKVYTSLQALRGDATSVAVIRPTALSHVETVSGASFTVTTVTVQRTVAGATLPQTIELRQTSGGQEDSQSAVVSPSNAYLVFLQPFQFTPGTQVGGQWVVVGDPQGLYVRPASAPTSDSTPFSAVAPGPPGLPSQITPAQVATAG